jgi:hypothetical protein
VLLADVERRHSCPPGACVVSGGGGGALLGPEGSDLPVRLCNLMVFWLGPGEGLAGVGWWVCGVGVVSWLATAWPPQSVWRGWFRGLVVVF